MAFSYFLTALPAKYYSNPFFIFCPEGSKAMDLPLWQNYNCKLFNLTPSKTSANIFLFFSSLSAAKCLSW